MNKYEANATKKRSKHQTILCKSFCASLFSLINKVNEINYLGKKLQVRSWLHLATSRLSIMRLSLKKKMSTGRQHTALYRKHQNRVGNLPEVELL